MSAAMTARESQLAIEGLAPQMDRFARLLVTKGVAVRPGQELVVSAPIEGADLVRRVVAAGYAAGAGHVTVIWADDALMRLEYENVDIEYFKKTPSWKVEQMNSLAEQGACFLMLDGSDPSALKGIDPAKPAAARSARNADCDIWRAGLDFGRNAWCIAGVPVRAWARQVFPDLGEDEALYRLWLAILDVSRASGEDPMGAWETHNASFEKNKRFLNGNHFDALRYRSSNGTDLTIGMNDRHIWEGGAGKTVDGNVFFPNIPTEEVFTTPDRMRVDGTVHSALPLVHNGSVVRDFWFAFEGGKVVDYDAVQGKDVLTHILETDEGARRLGEVALISKNTPIRQSGLIFYSTLYDENASCHLALGKGFPDCYEGGEEMGVDELLEHGVNHSNTHVDFMIGADDLDIVGIAADGTETPVFVNGQWAWE